MALAIAQMVELWVITQGVCVQLLAWTLKYRSATPKVSLGSHIKLLEHLNRTQKSAGYWSEENCHLINLWLPPTKSHTILIFLIVKNNLSF